MPRGLKEDYSPRYETYAGLAESYRSEDALNGIMDALGRAPVQLKILQRLVELLIGGGGMKGGVRKTELSAGMNFSPSAYRALVNKKILREYREQTVRLPDVKRKLEVLSTLTGPQQKALDEIRSLHRKNKVVLLRGVTSSGKTEIYIHLIREMLDQGKQVLYLLPEIALTAQIIERLRKVFGDAVGIYHSRYSDSERVETFLRSRKNPLGGEYGVLLGARSAVFLPFRDLGLVIVDEEHEPSYKQADPAPRYQARDAAIVLAGIHSAGVLLGSATPSLESYYNARSGKYGLVELDERYGKISQPEVILANLREAYRKKRMVSYFTPELYSLMKETVEADRQMILFQNRRGFSPYIQCLDCSGIPECPDCDVSLVYHKQENSLVCHYCGHTETVPAVCGECGGTHLVTRGFGTEKLEEEVEILFPGVPVARMDLDTTRSRRKYEKIIRDFETGNTSILVGTQIVTKGLDFDRVALVGVLHADNLLNFPDFRSHERSYQLISQVAGRAGRRESRGKVVVQTSVPDHPVIRHILDHDFHAMYLDQMEDRKAFRYPPYTRLVRITMKHADRKLLEKAADDLVLELKGELLRSTRSQGGKAPEILGPQSPIVSRVQQMHLMTILIKLPRSREIGKSKEIIAGLIEKARSDRQYGKLFITPDVDPY